jgi:5-methylcytosine-specific restriction endonuclease McrA
MAVVMKMKKSCQYCGRIHELSGVCKLKPSTEHSRANTKERRFRHSFAWRKKRAEILERDNYLCKICLHLGRLVYHDIHVHHIKSLADRFDLRLTDSNLISLCRDHHIMADSGAFTPEFCKSLVNGKIPPLHAGV